MHNDALLIGKNLPREVGWNPENSNNIKRLKNRRDRLLMACLQGCEQAVFVQNSKQYGNPTHQNGGENKTNAED